MSAVGRDPFRRGLSRALVALVLVALLLAPLTVSSHIIREEPWHPVPAAMLRTLFYLKLQPVDWDRVALELDHVDDPDWTLESVWAGLAPPASVGDGDPTTALRGALEARDADAFAAASTRALSRLVRAHLHDAAEALGEPGAAHEAVLAGQRIYRAFDRFVRWTDPAGARDLGLAWLQMTTSVGSAGVEGRGRLEADRERFTAARATVDAYLAEQYEGATPGVDASFNPVPADHVGAEVPPWLPPGADLNDQVPLPRLVLNFEERGIDEKDLFLVAYGDMLFDSPEIFGDPARSVGIACATCHNRSDINRGFFIPGISGPRGSADVDGHFFNPRFNDRRSDPLDIPTLRGLRFTAPYGRDGRFASIRDFTRNVIVNEFAGDEPTPLMLDALVTYMLEFDWLPAPYLEPDGTLTADAPAAARRGEEIFNRPFAGFGDRSCATCHVPADNFMDRRRHDVGSKDPIAPGARDAFFDTPTLINVTHTAPYMHDGSLATLGAVIDWFDARFELGLSDAERADLTAYVEAVGTGSDPYEIFDDENTPFVLFWGELSTFASTLSTLIPARDAVHADLLIRTVAPDLRADASALQDLSQAPKVYELADRLEAIREAILADDWTRAESLWAAYLEVEAVYGPTFR